MVDDAEEPGVLGDDAITLLAVAEDRRRQGQDVAGTDPRVGAEDAEQRGVVEGVGDGDRLGQVVAGGGQVAEEELGGAEGDATRHQAAGVVAAPAQVEEPVGDLGRALQAPAHIGHEVLAPEQAEMVGDEPRPGAQRLGPVEGLGDLGQRRRPGVVGQEPEVQLQLQLLAVTVGTGGHRRHQFEPVAEEGVGLLVGHGRPGRLRRPQ